MAKTIQQCFDLYFEINFQTVIRGHHVYKIIWTPLTAQVLIAKRDERREPLDYDKYSIGIFKRSEEDTTTLTPVGHVPVELSKLLNQFLKAGTGNGIYVEITGKRKREDGLVVPAKFSARTNCSRTAKVLDEQLVKIEIFYLAIETQKKRDV